MKKLDFAQTVGLLANVGVIAGIVFLGLELRQNNSLLEAQTSYAQFSIERERRARLQENRGGLLDAQLKARDGEELTRSERGQVVAYWFDVLDSWQWQFRENQAGRLPIELIDVGSWRSLWELDEGLQAIYHDTTGRRDAEFLRIMEENVILAPE